MAPTLAGWVAAGLAALIAVLIWRSMAARMEAVARASHELRGPITAARLGVQLGIRVGELSPAGLRAIELELGRAALALEDLAEVPRRRSPRAHDTVDVAGLLADSAEGWRASAAAGGSELRIRWVGPPGYVRGDRIRLAQATGNLIANAIEHGGGMIEVRGRADDGDVRLEVIDGGPGLPAPVAELARRARAGRGRRGRGLAIAAAIAADHGGGLAAGPTQRGARLVLQLPAEAGRGSPTEPVRRPS